MSVTFHWNHFIQKAKNQIIYSCSSKASKNEKRLEENEEDKLISKLATTNKTLQV